MCDRICKETALYARVAISGTLGAIGEPALQDLIALVGTVGHNQHLLVRDMVQRSLLKIRTGAAHNVRKRKPLM